MLKVFLNNILKIQQTLLNAPHTTQCAVRCIQVEPAQAAGSGAPEGGSRVNSAVLWAKFHIKEA